MLYVTAVKLTLAATCLFLASYQDIKAREVDDRVWLTFGPCAVALTAVEALLSRDPHLYAMIAIGSAASAFIIGLATFYARLIGGADAKCLWCLSLTFPWHPLKGWEGAWPFDTYLPFFPISIFNSAVFVSAAAIIAIFIINVIKLAKGEPLLQGLDDEGTMKKVALLFMGLKVDVSKLSSGDFYRPLEVVEEGRRRARFFPPSKVELPNVNKVWAMPNLPFVVSLSIGLLTSIIIGDLALLIISSFLRA